MKGNLILTTAWASLGALLPIRDLISHLPVYLAHKVLKEEKDFLASGHS